MGAGRFFEDEARKRVKKAVAAIEAQSGAEIVVAVRERSLRYRHAHFLFGFIVALVLLCVLLFLPQTFDIDFWPLELTGAFVLGAAFCMGIPPLERLFATQRVMAEQVRCAAKAAFFDLGVSYTRARSGLLIYVSMGERRAELVADVGLKDAAFDKARDAIADAAARADFDAFIAGLEALAAPLAKALPRAEDDINELPDGVA